MRTVQAPQSAIPQPNLVPVRPISSRSVHSRGISPGKSKVCDLPLISSRIIGFPSPDLLDPSGVERASQARRRDAITKRRKQEDQASSPFDEPELVADANLPVLEHVGAQPAAVRERIEQRLGDDAFEIPAWLAQALPLAENAADEEAKSDQRVQRDAAGSDIAARLARSQRDSQAFAQGFEYLGFDESEGAASARRAGEVTPPRRIPVAFQADSCEHPDPIRRPHRLPFADRDVDPLDAARPCAVRHASSYQLARKGGLVFDNSCRSSMRGPACNVGAPPDLSSARRKHTWHGSNPSMRRRSPKVHARPGRPCTRSLARSRTCSRPSRTRPPHSRATSRSC